jgi:dipeptidyl aminopeptidase/acylaminoacyl peptidase
VPAGAIGNPGWHRSHPRELAFTLNSPQSAGDVQVLDTATGTLTRWAAAAGAIDAHGFAQPEVVRWKSFDGRTISGLLYLPPARFAGPRPVVIAIHGGPEAQATVAFNGRWNYLINELGVALLEPNVRGSRGYGKTFLDLDNGLRREDAVRDIGALLDWIATDPRLDAKRVLVQGGSYGGYMVLASLVHYSDRLRGGIDVVGISDFITFLNNTESYRRELRRSEYGDERDPAMRAYLQKISPLANAERSRAPLFVVHGKNDPRVPVGEAEQIAARVRANGQPVWLLIADNEGHGFARKANADYYFYALVKFVEDVLLGK